MDTSSPAEGKKSNVQIWNTNTFDKVEQLVGDGFPVTSLDWSADSEQLAYPELSGYVWNTDHNTRSFTCQDSGLSMQLLSVQMDISWLAPTATTASVFGIWRKIASRLNCLFMR